MGEQLLPDLNDDADIEAMEGQFTVDDMFETFGSQIMTEFDSTDNTPVMTGGPTWTGGQGQRSQDDGDTGPGDEN